MNITPVIPAKILFEKHKVDYNSWALDWLAYYIEKLQRKTVIERSKEILLNIQQINRCRVTHNGYFIELEKYFVERVNWLVKHMCKEEEQLFPFVRKIILARELNQTINNPEMNKMEGLIQLLNDEHARESGNMNLSMEIKGDCLLKSNFSKPVNNLLAGLAEFEQAWELHSYLQSNFLFPKIIEIKKEVV